MKNKYHVVLVEMHCYEVNNYNPIIAQKFELDTYAVSKAKAISNAKFRILGKDSGYRAWSHDECRYYKCLSCEVIE